MRHAHRRGCRERRHDSQGEPVAERSSGEYEAIKEAILGQIPEDNDVQITQIANQAKSI